MHRKIADKTNQVASPKYWPDVTDDIGISLPEGITHGLRTELYIAVAGGVTVTVEWLPGTSAEVGSTLVPSWQPITVSLVNLVTGGTAANYVDTSAVLDLSGLTGRIRVKAAYSDATNTTLIVLVTD